MERINIIEKLQELEETLQGKIDEKDKLMAEIGTHETAIKISQSKVITIDENILELKSEMTKYKNCIEIMDR